MTSEEVLSPQGFLKQSSLVELNNEKVIHSSGAPIQLKLTERCEISHLLVDYWLATQATTQKRAFFITCSPIEQNSAKLQSTLGKLREEGGGSAAVRYENFAFSSPAPCQPHLKAAALEFFFVCKALPSHALNSMVK